MSHGDTLDVPAEALEALYPFRVERVALRTDSGGPGTWRGGLGLERLFTVLALCTARTSIDPMGVPPGASWVARTAPQPHHRRAARYPAPRGPAERFYRYAARRSRPHLNRRRRRLQRSAGAGPRSGGAGRARARGQPRSRPGVNGAVLTPAATRSKSCHDPPARFASCRTARPPPRITHAPRQTARHTGGTDERRQRRQLSHRRKARAPAALTWHTRIRRIVACGWFFDAFDTLTIAYVLPVIVPLWHIPPAEIGALIAISFGGQAIGALLCGWLAERYGRVPVAACALLLFASAVLPARLPGITPRCSGCASCRASGSAARSPSLPPILANTPRPRGAPASSYCRRSLSRSGCSLPRGPAW